MSPCSPRVLLAVQAANGSYSVKRNIASSISEGVNIANIQEFPLNMEVFMKNIHEVGEKIDQNHNKLGKLEENHKLMYLS